MRAADRAAIKLILESVSLPIAEELEAWKAGRTVKTVTELIVLLTTRYRKPEDGISGLQRSSAMIGTGTSIWAAAAGNLRDRALELSISNPRQCLNAIAALLSVVACGLLVNYFGISRRRGGN